MCTLLPLVADYGSRKAILWLEGQEELAKPDDDLCSFLARQDVEWDLLTESDRDTIRDEYLETIKFEMSKGLALPVSVHAEGLLDGPEAIR